MNEMQVKLGIRPKRHHAHYEDSHSYPRGTRHAWRFHNGRGASVIRNEMSYGSSRGLWELAVIGRDGDIDYSTPITDDVLGWLTPTDVRRILREIEALPR
jgi:hypothetical protein